MRNFKAILMLVLVAFVATMTGCASGPYQSKLYKSEAWNITKAAGAKYINDTKAENTEGGKVKLEGNTPGLGGFLGDTIVGGFSYSVPALLISSKAELERMPAIIGWMPEDMAASEEDALAKYQEIIKAAYVKAVNETDWPSYATVRIEGENRIIDYSRAEHRKECVDMIPPFIEKKPGAMKSNKIEKVSAPDFLGGGNAWKPKGNKWYLGFPLSKGLILCGNREPGREPYLLPEYNFLKNVSKNLPAWMFIYVAPAETLSNYVRKEFSIPAKGLLEQMDDGAFRYIYHPVVLHQGEELNYAKQSKKRSPVLYLNNK